MDSSTQKGTALRRFAPAALVVASGVWLDQVTKLWAVEHLRGRPFQELVEGYAELRFSLNPGAFFGFGGRMPSTYRQGFFVLASSVAVALILRLYGRLDASQRAARWGLVCLLTGAVGNLIDRVKRGEVVDFMHLHLREVFHWATFNVADIYIAAGMCLLIVDLLRAQTPAAHPRRDAAHTT